MGWDAYAEPVERLWAWKHGRDGIRDPKQDKAFKAAEKRVIKMADQVDGFLRQGGLDVSNCAYKLQEATGASCWGPDWSAEKVKRFAKDAYWDKDCKPEDLWAQLSAKEFLETCAKLGLSIRFTW